MVDVVMLEPYGIEEELCPDDYEMIEDANH